MLFLGARAMTIHDEKSEQFEVSASGQVVGPVTLDQVQRGVESGKIPRDAQGRKVGSVEWVPVALLLARPSEVAASPSLRPIAVRAPDVPVGGGGRDRYKNLLAVSESLRTYGGLLKVLAGVVVVGSLLAGWSAGGAWVAALFIGGVGFGLVLYATGLLIAAMGEGLLALADIATNTTPSGHRS
jgi:hypothetical protein